MEDNSHFFYGVKTRMIFTTDKQQAIVDRLAVVLAELIALGGREVQHVSSALSITGSGHDQDKVLDQAICECVDAVLDIMKPETAT